MGFKVNLSGKTLFQTDLKSSYSAEETKQWQRKFRYLRSLGMSKYEANAYCKMNWEKPAVKKVLEEQKRLLKRIATVNDLTEKQAAKRLRSERDAAIDELPEGEMIPAEYDVFFRLYPLEAAERPWYKRPTKPVYA